MKKWILLGAAGLVVSAGVLVLPVGGSGVAQSTPKEVGTPPDLAEFSAEKPARPVRLLFIHHSCGGQLFADPGPDVQPGRDCIYDSHPNGGALKKGLAANGYEVHEASYGSAIGEHTDLFDWLPKFRDKMDTVLKVAHQDQLYPDDRRNEIVLFKSCFPNNEFVGRGEAPGNPAGPELTVWNAKASLSALLPELKKQPNVLFVYVTAPPIAPKPSKTRLYKYVLKTLQGRSTGPTAAQMAQAAELAREFNNWVVSPDGWLKDYAEKNVVVFDYYGVLTGHGQSNLLVYPTGDGHDSHPARAGNERAAAELLPFLNRAVRRAGVGGGPLSDNAPNPSL